MLSRISAARRLPAFASSMAKARYSSRVEGSTASSKEFNKKERAHEDQYARQHEAEQLKKLKAQIEEKRQELAHLEQQHEDISKKD